MDTRSILLIDEHERRQRKLGKQLADLSFIVFSISKLKDLPSISSANHIDIAVFEIQVLLKNGLSSLYQLKSKYPNLYSIVISPKDDLKEAASLLTCGIDTFIMSPISTVTVEATLLQASEVLKLREELESIKQEKQKVTKFYESLLDISHDAIVVTDQNFGISYCNSTFRKFMDTKENLIGVNLQSCIDDGFKVLHYTFQQLTIGKKIFEQPISLKATGKEILDLHLSADFLYTTEGYVEGLVAIMENHTVESQAFMQLMRKVKLETIQHLTDILAHEIQNPTNILSGRAQLLKKEINNQDHDKSFDIIKRQVERITEIIAKLRKFSLHKEDSVPEVFPLIEFLEELLQKRNDYSNVSYKLHYQKKEKDILVQANHLQFEDAFSYLFLTIDKLVSEDTLVNIQCGLLKSISHNPCLELQIDFSETGITENIFNPFENVPHNERHSLLDSALINIIFSNYGGKIHVEDMIGDKKNLKLQFSVAGVKSLTPKQLNNQKKVS